MPIEIKICGLTNRDDLCTAIEAGADYVGFVLYERSARGISVSRMQALLAGLAVPVRAVGVFVNMARAEVERVCRDTPLYAAQMHGDEDVSDFLGFPGRMWRAVALRGGQPVPEPAGWPADRYVLDAAVAGQYGGTGVKADWDWAASMAQCWPVMLAGGLTALNVEDAVRRVRPRGVDVASGVEMSPGRKDPVKVRAFVAAVRGAEMVREERENIC
jgi:phosphoribosylanthranilate isomerase